MKIFWKNCTKLRFLTIIPLFLMVVFLVFFLFQNVGFTNVPVGIVGQDNRVQVDNRLFPWSAIGKVIRGPGMGYCSGVLVGPRHVVTAAHCMFDLQNKRPVYIFELKFVVQQTLSWQDTFTAQSKVEKVFVNREYDSHYSTDLGMIADDWAFLVLKDKLPVTPIPITKNMASYYIREGEMLKTIRAGYSFDHDKILTADDTCHFYGQVDDGRLLIHDCDSTEGDSGSPFLIVTSDQNEGEFDPAKRSYEVAAIHVAVSKNDKNQHGLAVPMGLHWELIQKLIKENP